MLKNIDPLLNADVLYALRAMGHGDELILCDANFPAEFGGARDGARQAAADRRHRAPARGAGDPVGLSPRHVRRACRARMEVVEQPDEIPPVQAEVQREIERASGRSSPMGSIERLAFYERAKQSYCVVATGERRFYGCFVFQKGVIPPA